MENREGFHVSGACYPECHQEAENIVQDIQNLKKKVDAGIPAKLSKVLQKFGDDPIAMRDAGIAYAVNQIIDLVANGVEGVHIYTMNDPYVARKITEGVSSIVNTER